MTDAEQQPTDAEQRAEREAQRLSYRGNVPEAFREEFDRLTRRMNAQAAASVIRHRISRRKAEAALPAAEAVVAQLRRY